MAETRATDRQAAVTFRMSPSDLQGLRDEAAALGVPVQRLVYSRVFGSPLDRVRRPGPSPQQELPLTG